jgi:hypothetical protein
MYVTQYRQPGRASPAIAHFVIVKTDNTPTVQRQFEVFAA